MNEHGGHGCLVEPERTSKLIRIEQAWEDCQRCVLSRCGRNGIVMGVGPDDANLMMIGEAPGEQEDLHLEPFVGPAGMVLRRAADEVGIDTREVYITNLVACRPPDNRVPMFDEIAACRDRLEQLVAAIEPIVILVLGSTPLTPITGKQGITRNRGKWVDSRWSWKGKTRLIPTMPTFHPAGLLPGRIKDPRDLELFKLDIRLAYDRANE